MNLKDSYDVVVVGGGPGGVCAAVSAAKLGASTLLVERYGFLGGMATAGLVNPFMSYKSGTDFLSNEIFNEILLRLSAEKALCKDGMIFDDEILKIVLDEMMADYGVDLLFHSFFTDVTMKEGRIALAHFTGKSGHISVAGNIFIDSTGDGDVASAAGAPFEIGRDEDSACQPMSLCFRVSGIAGNPDPVLLAEELTTVLNEAKVQKKIDQPREDVLLFGTLVPGTYHFNTTRILGKLGTSTFDLTYAELEGRRQTKELLTLFRRHSPRFAHTHLVKMAMQIGVRESRRILTEYIITDEDILAARKFPDGIVRSNYPIDIHNPLGSGTVLKEIPDNDFYEIPLRCLMVADIENLIIGSRCIGSTHIAHSSLRIMPVVAGIGEAAGIAAVSALRENIIPAQLNGSVLKEQILGSSSRQKGITAGIM